MRKNITIAILMVIVAGLSISLYRARRYPKTFVAEMLPAVEKQRQICDDLASQVDWLRKHLEKTISELEAEYNLEPMPVYDPYNILEEMKTSRPRPPVPFVVAYEKLQNQPYDTYTIDFRNEEGLCKLSCLINTTSLFALNSTGHTEGYIDNFYQRLQRLEPIIKKDQTKQK